MTVWSQRPSLKPLPRRRRPTTEKELLPRGVVSQGAWERKTFRAAFAKEPPS